MIIGVVRRIQSIQITYDDYVAVWQDEVAEIRPFYQHGIWFEILDNNGIVTGVYNGRYVTHILYDTPHQRGEERGARAIPNPVPPFDEVPIAPPAVPQLARARDNWRGEIRELGAQEILTATTTANFIA